MSPQKKKDKTVSGGQKNTPGGKKNVQKFKPVPANITPAQIDGLDEIAKAESKSRSEVVRDAIDIYLRNFKEGKYQSKESEVARELRRIEKRLATLLVKSIKIGGQALYFSTMPYTEGLPKGRIVEGKAAEGKTNTEVHWARFNQVSFNNYFDKSHAFAVQLMRAKTKSEEDPEALVPESPTDEPKK